MAHIARALVLVLATAASVPSYAAPPGMTDHLPLGLPTRPLPPASLANIAFGQYLFQSGALSADGTISCSSCHRPALGYAGDTPRAVGLNGFIAGRHAPPLANLYLFRSYMADGRAADLPHQHLLPLESQEMNIDWPTSLLRLAADPQATKLQIAAGISTLSRQTILDNLAAFVGSLVTGNSRFDQFYYGGQAGALNQAEQRGLRIFTHKARCATCHLLDGRAAPFTDGSFHATGIGFRNGEYTDQGRYDVTHKAEDDGLFKTSSLRNVALRPFLMHDGSLMSLEQVVRFYNAGGQQGAKNLDGRLRPLYLTDGEIHDLVEFLGTLNAPVAVLTGPAPSHAGN